jgi:DNA polymerase-3 subunit alpha
MSNLEISNSDFVHLHCHSEYSLLDGAAHLEDMVKTVAHNGQVALGLTDHGNMHGALDLYRECKGLLEGNEKAKGIDFQGNWVVKPIVGIEAYITPATSRFDKNKAMFGKPGQEKDDVSARGSYTHMTLWAANNTGMHNLFQSTTLSYKEGMLGKYPRMDRDILSRYSEGVIASSGCPSGEIQTRLRLEQFDEALRVAGELQEIYGKDNFYIELMDHNMELETKLVPELVEISKLLNAPLLATNDSHYCSKNDAITQEALLAINTGAKLSDPDRFKFDGEGYYLKNTDEMITLFKEFPEAITNTREVADKCNVEFVKEDYMPRIDVPEGHTQESYLREQVDLGIQRIYGDNPAPEVLERVKTELDVIVPKGFSAYFLVVAEFIQWAKANNIFVGPGRGSAAGAIVAYALGITQLDPLQYGLLFERFLNPEREEMPDIDVDFEQANRGKVLQHIKDLYGEELIYQVVTFSYLKAKSALKDALRLEGVDFDASNRISKAYPAMEAGEMPDLKEIYDKSHERYNEGEDLRGIIEESPEYTKAFDLALKLNGLIRNTGIHASAVIMSNTPIADIVPTMTDKTGEGVTQFENHRCEDLGLVKMDFLGLQTLDLLHMTLDNIKALYNVEIDLNKIPLDDEKTFDLLRSGRTIGCFQIEKGYVQALIKKMKLDSVNDIIAINALNRPGPMGEGTHTRYAARKIGEEAVEPLDQKLDEKIGPILQETYGLIVYQEQILKISQALAGFSAGKADGLRKAMGKKDKQKLEEMKNEFITGAINNGYDTKSINRLWEIMEPFGKYAFNKAHSACYGIIAYQTAYLKANYPVEFMANLLNTEFRNKEKTGMYLQECRAMNIKVSCPDVNKSQALNASDKKDIRLGFLAIANVGENIATPILKAREEKGEFESFYDFMEKVPSMVLNKRVIESLIKAGAFDSFGHTRKALLMVHEEYIASIIDMKHQEEDNGQVDLFSTIDDTSTDQVIGIEIPKVDEWHEDQVLDYEREFLGYYISSHPLQQYENLIVKNQTHSIGEIRAMTEEDHSDEIEVKISGMMTNAKHLISKRGNGYGAFEIEDLTAKTDARLFGRSYAAMKGQIFDSNLVTITGRYNPADNNPSVLVTNINTLQEGEEVDEKSKYEKMFQEKLTLSSVILPIDRKNLSNEVASKIVSVLQDNNGSAKVFLEIDNGSKKSKMEMSVGIVDSTNAIKQLEAITNTKAVCERS